MEDTLSHALITREELGWSFSENALPSQVQTFPKSILHLPNAEWYAFPERRRGNRRECAKRCWQHI